MSNEDRVKPYETISLPAVGEFRARPGTATYEIAGAAKYWHTKSKTAWIEGVTAGSVTTAVISVIGILAYNYIRSH